MRCSSSSFFFFFVLACGTYVVASVARMLQWEPLLLLCLGATTTHMRIKQRVVETTACCCVVCIVVVSCCGRPTRVLRMYLNANASLVSAGVRRRSGFGADAPHTTFFEPGDDEDNGALDLVYASALLVQASSRHTCRWCLTGKRGDLLAFSGGWLSRGWHGPVPSCVACWWRGRGPVPL